MKKTIAILALLFIFTTPSHALNLFDKLMYKKDVLRSNNTQVLVNRLTGEIKYVCREDGKQVPLTGQWKEQYQKMYDGQNVKK